MSRYIDADALMREFAEFVRRSNNSDFAKVPTWNDAVSLLGSAPTIGRVKHGKWIEIPIGGYTKIMCSACRWVFVNATGKWKYCPNCGAKMESSEE